MSTFKIGDRVILRNDESNWETMFGSEADNNQYEDAIGQEQTVTAVRGNMISTGRMPNPNDPCIFARRFDLASLAADELEAYYEDDPYNYLDEEPASNFEGYYEPCSTYTAALGFNDEWVVEATRVKTICVADSEEEAVRIAEALNFTSGNAEYQID